MVSLAEQLLARAAAPLDRAARQLERGRVIEALGDVGRDALSHALAQAMSACAAQSGVRADEVRRILGGEEFDPALERIEIARLAALGAWTQRTNSGGLLPGIGELTQRPPSLATIDAADADFPDVAGRLSRLARKVARDEELASPLERLAEQLEGWQTRLRASSAAVASSKRLASARQRRFLRFGAALGVAACAIGAGAWLVGVRVASRKSVEEALRRAGACGAQTISASDLDRASEEQRARYDVIRKRCDDERSRAQADAAAAREVETRNERCSAAIAKLEAGQLAAEDAKILTGDAALLDRIAQRALEPADLRAKHALSCGGLQSDSLERTFAAAAAQSALAWAQADGVSRELIGGLRRGPTKLTPTSQQNLARRAEALANTSLIRGDPAMIEGAKSLCDLEAALGMEWATWCKAMAAVAARQK